MGILGGTISLGDVIVAIAPYELTRVTTEAGLGADSLFMAVFADSGSSTRNEVPSVAELRTWIVPL